MKLLSLILPFLFSTNVNAIVDYCSINVFNTSTSYMQFTKEVSNTEYTEKGKFKGLHCCSKGYRSIEWYKDGRPYPWSDEVSGFILYPESSNQTVYTQNSVNSDSGTYTCVVRNDTHMYSRKIALTVMDKSPEVPKITYISNAQYKTVSDTVRLFCEAYVGHVDLPDATSDVTWHRIGSNQSIEENDSRVSQEKVSREDDRILGSYLNIKTLQREDFGEFNCRIKTLDTFVDINVDIFETFPDSYFLRPAPWSSMIFILIILALILLKLFLVYMKFGRPVRLVMKDRFGKIEENDGKTHDVAVFFNEQDSEIVRGMLAPMLEGRYKYSCELKSLPEFVGMWHKELQDNSNKSRRLITILSPACFDGKWDESVILTAAEQLVTLNIPLITVVLKEIPKITNQAKNSRGETLKSMLQKLRVIELKQEKCAKFWESLRLWLPPKRPQNDTNIVLNEVNVTRLNYNSQESLEILV